MSFKARFRLYMKSNSNSRVFPATPTSTILRSGDGRKFYRVWSDGSYRKMAAPKGRRLVAV